MVTRICKKNDQLDAEICFPQHMEFNEKDAKLLATPFASVKHFASEEVASECGVRVPANGERTNISSGHSCFRNNVFVNKTLPNYMRWLLF